MIKKVTLKDIAEDSGLSISTVSRALTRSGKISKENERLVFESAHRLNYPLAAQNTPIELRENINIALVTRHYTGEFFASLFEGFDLATERTNTRMSLISVSHRSSTPAKILASLKRRHYDAAVIFLPDYTSSDYTTMLASIPADFPVISIAPIANPVFDTITFDNYRGGHLVAQHFEELGYRNLGIVQGPFNKSEAMLRKNGFIDYIQASPQLNLVWEFNGDYSIQRGKEAYEFYKKSVVKPDAIFCSNDGTTIGFMHSAIRDGVNIPGEVAVVGFDDLPTCDLYTPTISSVHTSYELLGRKVIEVITEKLSQDSPAHQTGYMSLVPVSLTVRESSTELTRTFKNYNKSLT